MNYPLIYSSRWKICKWYYNQYLHLWRRSQNQGSNNCQPQRVFPVQIVWKQWSSEWQGPILFWQVLDWSKNYEKIDTSIHSLLFFHRNLLQVVNGQGTKYYIGSKNKNYYPIVKFPDGLSCDQCILQVIYMHQLRKCI